MGPAGRTVRMTRREILAALAAAAASAALPATAAAGPAGRQWAVVIDLRRCDGCEACTRACQRAHGLGPDQTWIKTYRFADASGRIRYMPRLCMHCENAPCIRVCPVAATYKNAEGVVLVDQNKCIGCRTCMAACPYEARYFNWTEPPVAAALSARPMPEFPVPQQKGTVGKCILCVHNTQAGDLPVCVEACPMGALFIADLGADAMTNGRETFGLASFLRENDAIRFREELGTRPRVWYVLGHGQRFGL